MDEGGGKVRRKTRDRAYRARTDARFFGVFTLFTTPKTGRPPNYLATLHGLWGGRGDVSVIYY